MARVHDFIEVAVSSETAFQHWLSFEDYPQFMAGVQRVWCRDGRRVHWHARANGRMEEWDCEIVDSVPPLRLAWRGERRECVVVLRATGWGSTRVYVEMDQEPLEPARDPRHYFEAALWRVHADLENFKEWVEQRTRH